jgi:hypothetical protein
MVHPVRSPAVYSASAVGVDGTFAAPVHRTQREEHLPLCLGHAGQAGDVHALVASIVPKYPQAGAGIRRPEIPGREIVQVLTGIPAGMESGWHIHPGEEVGYILAGTVEMMVPGQPLATLTG